MADVFLSYSRKDRAKIEPIARGLGKLGIAVWYDARLQSGASFDEVIAHELDEATVVVACWSPDAIASKWTRSEALFALDQQKLAAVFLDSCKLNPPFNLIHADDLTDWQGQPGHHGFAQLIERIAAALQRPGLVEMNAAFAAGDDALYDWAKRYPDEPRAKEIWRSARARHEIEFETETEAARAEIERLAAARKEAALAALAACRENFTNWIEAERTGIATKRPDPRASLKGLSGAEEEEAVKRAAAALSQQVADARLRITELEKRSELESAKATQALSLLDAANREIAQRSTHMDKLQSETTQERRRADAALIELKAARAEASTANEQIQKLHGERDRLVAKADTDLAEANSKLKELSDASAETAAERDGLAAKLALHEAESERESSELDKAKPLYEGRYAILLGVVMIILIWLVAFAAGWARLPAPGAVLERLGQPAFWGGALQSAADLVMGVAEGAVVAAGTILLMRRVKPARALLTPILRALVLLPLAAPIPLFAIWFGGGLVAVATVAFMSFVVAAAMLEPSIGGPWRDPRPSAANRRASLVLTARRYAALALLLTITCEVLESNTGLGFYMAEAMGNYVGTDAAAVMIILILMGIALDRIVAWAVDILARRRPVSAAAPPGATLPPRASDGENRGASRPARGSA
jgi:ABC-type nitrate/sulfonate/bicarbonate transport system permease component